MKLATTLFVLATSYASFLAAQESSTSDGIVTIQPVTSIIPSSIASTPPPLSETTQATRTSTRLGGSQVEPTSFSTSRPTISDVSTDRPTRTTSISSGTPSVNPSASTTATSPPSTTAATSAAASPTSTNAATGLAVDTSVGLVGALAILGGALLV